MRVSLRSSAASVDEGAGAGRHDLFDERGGARDADAAQEVGGREVAASRALRAQGHGPGLEDGREERVERGGVLEVELGVFAASPCSGEANQLCQPSYAAAIS